MKSFGHFDDAFREYVITDPATPWPWINYMGTEDFFSLISNTAGGYCFCKDAKFRRILRYRYNGVPMDDGGRYYYIKDGDTVWNPGWKPCKTPLDFYECRHGMGYTRVTGEKDGLKADVLFFVPIGHRCEVHRVKLTNTGAAKKSFSSIPSWNGAFGTRRRIWRTSSGTCPPARWRSRGTSCTTRPNTASAATITPSSV